MTVPFICHLCQAWVPSCLVKCQYGCGSVLKWDLTVTNTDFKYRGLHYCSLSKRALSNPLEALKTELKLLLGGIQPQDCNTEILLSFSAHRPCCAGSRAEMTPSTHLYFGSSESRFTGSTVTDAVFWKRALFAYLKTPLFSSVVFVFSKNSGQWRSSRNTNVWTMGIK